MREYKPPVYTPPLHQTALIAQLQKLFQNKSSSEETKSRALGFLKKTPPSERGKSWEIEVENFLEFERLFNKPKSN